MNTPSVLPCLYIPCRLSIVVVIDTPEIRAAHVGNCFSTYEEALDTMRKRVYNLQASVLKLLQSIQEEVALVQTEVAEFERIFGNSVVAG